MLMTELCEKRSERFHGLVGGGGNSCRAAVMVGISCVINGFFQED